MWVAQVCVQRGRWSLKFFDMVFDLGLDYGSCALFDAIRWETSRCRLARNGCRRLYCALLWAKAQSVSEVVLGSFAHQQEPNLGCCAEGSMKNPPRTHGCRGSSEAPPTTTVVR